MSDALIRRRELRFLLGELLEIEKLTQFPRFEAHTEETFDAAIDTAEKIATSLFAPHNALCDKEEPTFDGTRVHMRPEVKTAWDAFAEAGFIAGGEDFELGGMQLPETIVSACMAIFNAANVGTTAYSFLTMAAARVIKTFGSEQQKEDYFLPMLEGRYSGTMALTEPQAGSSLADITTSAEPTDESHYLIKGHKIYISAGEHELTENIIHLVLAKIKGAPNGVKGISLFIVPKYLPASNDQDKTRNDLALAGLFHKLGWRGTTSTALNFGEQNQCKGYLIGEPHKGLQYMFQMMNEARLGVGLGAATLAYRGYLYSLSYAQERPQGRHPSNRDPSSKPIPIIEHADVRRMLLAQKSYCEGALALGLYGAKLVDLSRNHVDENQREHASLLLDLLTPVIKAWSSEKGIKSNDLAIQVLGGAGYTREYPVEQFWRDNRLNPIHEGTNGIQALDLLGRKLWLHDSKGIAFLHREIRNTIASTQNNLNDLATTLDSSLELLSNITQKLGANLLEKGPDITLANASCYLNMFGNVVVAWLWLKQANIASAALENTSISQDEKSFYKGKIQTARYFFTWELPTIKHDADLLIHAEPSCFDMKAEWF